MFLTYKNAIFLGLLLFCQIIYAKVEISKKKKERETPVRVAVVWIETLPHLAVTLTLLLFIAIAAFVLDSRDRKRRKELQKVFGYTFVQSRKFTKLYPDIHIKYVALVLILISQLIIVNDTNFIPICLLNIACAVLIALSLRHANLLYDFLEVCWKFQFVIIMGRLVELSWPFPTTFYDLITAATLFLFVCALLVLLTIDNKDVEFNISCLKSKYGNGRWTNIILDDDNNNDNDTHTSYGYTQDDPNMSTIGPKLAPVISEDNDGLSGSRTPLSTVVRNLFPNRTNDYSELEFEKQLEQAHRQQKRQNWADYSAAKAEEDSISREELEKRKLFHDNEGLFG